MDAMKKDASAIGIWLLLGQIFFYGITVIVTLVFMLAGNMELGQMLGADLGSFVANALFMGIFRLKKHLIPIQETTEYISNTCKVVVMAMLTVFFWNALISMFDHIL